MKPLETNDPKMAAALREVDKILDNLAQSDFAVEHGTAALGYLKTFRIDMAADIAGEF